MGRGYFGRLIFMKVLPFRGAVRRFPAGTLVLKNQPLLEAALSPS